MVWQLRADHEQKQDFGDVTVTRGLDTQRPITEALQLHRLVLRYLPPGLTEEAAMVGVAVEQMLELWCAELRQVKAEIQPLFGHPSVAASAAAFLDGWLGSERRKTGWMRAEAAGDPGPWRQQAVLGRSHWNADALRDLVRESGLETLASPGAVLVIDKTGFLKQGLRSWGVGRPYTGSAGKINNSRICAFSAYPWG